MLLAKRLTVVRGMTQPAALARMLPEEADPWALVRDICELRTLSTPFITLKNSIHTGSVVLLVADTRTQAAEPRTQVEAAHMASGPDSFVDSSPPTWCRTPSWRS